MILHGDLLFLFTEEGIEIVKHPLGGLLEEWLDQSHPRFEEIWGILSPQCQGLECTEITPLGHAAAGRLPSGQWVISWDLETLLLQMASFGEDLQRQAPIQ